MSQYQKEYEEALSRLNAPERSPLPYAPIPYGPVPNKCNYMNWNRIMAETRQGVLPKYSILQRIDLSTQNDLVMVSDAKEYTFTLDPSFTFAKGARKSIAVRAVDIYNVIPNGQSKTAVEKFKGKCFLQYNIPNYVEQEVTIHNDETGEDETVKTQVRNDIPCVVTLDLRPISYTCTNDTAVSVNNFARAFGDMIYEATSEAEYGNGLLDENYTVYYNPNTKLIQVEFTTNIDNDWYFTKRTLTPANKRNKPRWVIKNSNVFDMYNTNDDRDIEILYSKLEQTNSMLFFITLPATILDYRSASICGSINPWTKNNLIAPLSYSSDTLTKVFPYNGCTEARFWFINENGEKVRWRSVRGYIDLELIIDNSDSYAMTGDN